MTDTLSTGTDTLPTGTDTLPISIVLPTLNEASGIAATLQPLQYLRANGGEIILADGGSSDATVDIAAPLVDRVVRSATGRAVQMNAGAAVARGDYVLFLHADTRLPAADMTTLAQKWHTGEATWGFFPLRLSGTHWFFPVIGFFISWRSRITSVATGDQCIFVRRDVFARLGGFMDIPLMEDIALSKQLRRLARPWVEALPALTSSRRWEQKGIASTILLMWRLRLAYFFGASPEGLARRYYPKSVSGDKQSAAKKPASRHKDKKTGAFPGV